MPTPAPTRRRRIPAGPWLAAMALAICMSLAVDDIHAAPPLKVGPTSPSLDWWDKSKKKKTKGANKKRPKTFLGVPLKPPPKRIPGEKIRKPEDDRGFRVAVGAFGGVDFYSFNLDLGNNNRDLGLSPHASPVYGARAGIDWDVYSVQVEGTWATSTYFADGPEATFQSIRGAALIHIPMYVFRPFILIGGGMWAVSGDPTPLTEDTDAAIHVGMGLRWNIKRWLGLRVEGRGIISDGHERGSMSLSWSAIGGLSFRLFTRS